ncbi:MAG: FAD/NAD(P)-binding protein [Devosia sp.]|nr:FAD/NAD(P)-binding protein [Devosia sp.]
MTGTRTILIIGGGASGTLLALQVLAQNASKIRVVLIDRSAEPGRGLAYGTSDDQHLLNVTPVVLSAFPDDPGHFRCWLERQGIVAADADPFVFVPRRHFGDYLNALLLKAQAGANGRLTLMRSEVASLHETSAGIELLLANGASVPGHVAVLATGHDDDCPADESIAGIDPDQPGPILILGTGLSMIDRWLSLRHAGYRGKVVAMSRRGLLPQVHQKGAPLRIDAADVPFGTSLPYFIRWLRSLAAEAVAEGGDWRAATDAIRPYSQRLWQSWSEATRQRFLVHARAWWDVHRHRLAPAVHRCLLAEFRGGQFEAIAGKPLVVKPGVGRQMLRFRRRGLTGLEVIEVAAVLDCRGLARDWEARPGTLIGKLVADGVARPDPLRIGLDVNDNCQVVDGDGQPSPRLFAVGPLTRGQFFEIEAIPDIRRQCVELARALSGCLLKETS